MYPPPDPNETILEKLRKKPRLLIVWPAFLLLCLATGVFTTALNFTDNPDSMSIMAAAVVVAIFAVCVLVLMLVIWPLVRWLFRKHLRATLMALAGLVALVVLFYIEEDWRGSSEWENFRAQQVAKGEKFDLASFVPPAVPDDQNFAMTPIVASGYASIIDRNGRKLDSPNKNIVNRLAMRAERKDSWSTPTPKNGDWAAGTLTDLQPWQNYFRAPVQTNAQWPFGTNEFPVASNTQSPAADVLLALGKYDPDMEELRQAATLRFSRFPLAYDADAPMQVWLPHLGALMSASSTLQLRAIAELQLSQPDKAAADIDLILRLAESTRNEPFLISDLVRMRQVDIALQAIYEGLAKHRWSEAQLVDFDSQLAQPDFLANYQRAMRSQTVFTARMVDYIQRTHKLAAFLETLNSANLPARKFFDRACAIVPAGWFTENKLRFSKFYLEECLPLVDMEKRKVSPAAVDRVESKLLGELRPPGPYNILVSLWLPPMARMTGNKYVFTERFVYAQECVDLSRVAIALERYRLAHGQYPDSLAALTPQFLAKVPRDIIGGGSLKYSRTQQSFILYSIGWNGIDDGGVRNPSKADQSTWVPGDWVWQYP
jgi:hypothetical protein